MQAIVGVDILELGLDAELVKHGQGLVAEMTALPGDKDDLHGSEASWSGRQVQDLPRLDHRARQAVGALDVIHTGSYVI